MMRGRLLAASLLIAILYAASGRIGAQAIPRAVYASALDSTGAPVANLGPADFVVREDKVAREILDVWPAADAMEIALLIDNSTAAEQYISEYRQALPAFIRALAEDETHARHQVAVITLAERPTVTADYSLDLEVPIKAVQRIFATPASATYLLDGIIETSKGISKRGAIRPVIVAITTEGPEYSDRQYQAVLEPLRASGATLHVIVVGRPTNNDHDRAAVLDMGTRESGGRYDTILTGTALTSRMRQVAAELTHQYKVTYARPQTLILPERITVSAAKPGLTVRGTPVRDLRERR